MNEILKPWYAVATPHEDIRKGRLEEAVFAANIWAVVQGTAPEVYLDPEEFYRKTYMTAGIGSVLKRVTGALLGAVDSGDRIISLQTAFGGGKTHTLVALWHVAKHADRLKKSPAAIELRKVLGDRFPEKVRNVAVFTNASCDATRGRKTPEGIHTRTLWGELAVQLGGSALYEKVRANDETRRVPQGIFADLLRESSPCLILLDELADYCVGAAAVPVGDTTLADQTISFIQQLTEAVHQVPEAAVVATLPASKYEVAQSEKGQEAFVTLEKRFQRLGADVKPVADDEIYDVVRARLFESIAPIEESDYPKKVAQAYQSMYAAHSGEVPSEASKNSYRDQIERAYPFHPLFIDALYTRWGSHPDFQRTRGVLRLLASVVGDLWQRRTAASQTQHLIQPCHIRWSIDAMQAALTRLWGPAYQSVAAADIFGEKSNAGVFDEERGGDYGRTAGSLGKRYWFSTKPTLNKLIIQYRQQNARESFDDDIVEDLRTQTQKGAIAGATWRVVVDPAKDLPEQKALTLLILPPSIGCNDGTEAKDIVKRRVLEISALCGGKDRLYGNTLVYLSGTTRGLNKLRQAHRERAALEGIRSDYWDQLDDDQKKELDKRLETAKRSSLEALGPAYTVALRVCGQNLEVCSLSDARQNFQEHLGYLWTVLLEDEEWILQRVGSVTLDKTGLIPKEGSLRLKDAVEAFLRFTDKHMISSKEAVTAGLTQACADGLVGIGRGGSPSTLQARYCKQTVSLDPNEDGVWIIPPFETEEPKEPAGLEPGIMPGETVVTTPTDITAAAEDTTIKDKERAGRIRRFVVRGAVPVENYGELFRCFVGPSARMNLKKLRLGVQFEMETQPSEGLAPNDPALKAMQEAARQLGLTFEAEE